MNDPRDTITEELKAYYDFVYSDENQEKARRAVELGEERRMKEEPPVFERGDYIERINFYKKMYDDFGEVALIAFPTHRDDLSEAVAAAKECWPNAKVTGLVVAFQDGSSGVEVLFNQMHKDND